MSPLATPDNRMKLRRVIIKLLEWGIHLATLATLVLPFYSGEMPEGEMREWGNFYWFDDPMDTVAELSFLVQWIFLMVLGHLGNSVTVLRLTSWLASMVLSFFGVLYCTNFMDPVGQYGGFAAVTICPMFTLLIGIQFEWFETPPKTDPETSSKD